MRGEDQVGMRHGTGPCADHIAGFIDVDVVKFQLLEEPLQFLAACFLFERRRRDLADADLLVDEMRLIALRGLEGGLYLWRLHQTRRVLSDRQSRRKGEPGDSAERNLGMHRWFV